VVNLPRLDVVSLIGFCTSVWEFDNNFMLFSSNRPGGKGGFDLYYVGVKK